MTFSSPVMFRSRRSFFRKSFDLREVDRPEKKRRHLQGLSEGAAQGNSDGLRLTYPNDKSTWLSTIRCIESEGRGEQEGSIKGDYAARPRSTQSVLRAFELGSSAHPKVPLSSAL